VIAWYNGDEKFYQDCLSFEMTSGVNPDLLASMIEDRIWEDKTAK
jgi:hypothetical protein